MLEHIKPRLRNRYSKQKNEINQTGNVLCSLTRENKEEVIHEIKWYKDIADNKYFLANK